jgi:hypothetical protein
MTVDIDYLLCAAVVVTGASGLTGLVFWLARREGGGRLPENFWPIFFAEFRWSVWNDLLFFRDLFWSPITGARMAIRAEDRRRRAHRRADSDRA